MTSAPAVSIAIPVYNGEQYVAAAIESVLAQDFGDVELIICDNASTDSTRDVCARYLDDDRVRYHRNITNLGAAPNFNKAFELAKGHYFKWLAADESIEPGFVGACVTALEDAPSAVLACTNYIGNNEITGDTGPQLFDLALPQPSANARFRTLLRRRSALVLPIWGLQRSGVMRTTGLIRSFVRADHVYVAEMAIRGTFVQVDEPLHQIRTHAEAYHWVYGRKRTDSAAESQWFDTSNRARRYLPHWRRLWEYMAIARLADGCPPIERARMLAFLLGPFLVGWLGPLSADLLIAAAGAERYQQLRRSSRS